MADSFAQDVKIIAEVTVGRYKVQVFDYADLWVLDAPRPIEWPSAIVYRAIYQRNGYWYKRDGDKLPDRVARVGNELATSIAAARAGYSGQETRQ